MKRHVMLTIEHGTITKKMQIKEFTLEQLQKAVGGYIELLNGFTTLTYDGKHYTRGTAYANEDGLSQGLRPNPLAAVAWRAAAPRFAQSLVGPVIFVATEQVEP